MRLICTNSVCGSVRLRRKLRIPFRIRYYNGDTSFLLLEKKSKIDGLCRKEQVRLSLAEAQEISGMEPVKAMDSTKPLDIAFLFWAIAAGIVLAAGMIPLAVFRGWMTRRHW